MGRTAEVEEHVERGEVTQAQGKGRGDWLRRCKLPVILSAPGLLVLYSASFFAAFGIASNAQGSENVRYPNVVLPGSNVERTTVHAEVYRPPGTGTFPAIMVLHGCGAVDAHHKRWAERLVSWGYVAVVIDSFSPRGFGNICKETTSVTPEMRVSDIYGTAEYLRKLPYIAKDRIGLLGFSHGAWTIMKAVQVKYQLKLFGVRGAVAYYPYCNPKLDANIDVPLLVLIGEDDDWTPAPLCRELQAAISKVAPFEMVFYPGARHAFDRPQGATEVSGWSVGGGVRKHKIGGDPKAAEDSFKRTREYFKRAFDRATP
ncbi:dienelactone hydrolase family protein [Bradyrhizobium sp. 160]|uniref:dienelactone hydrolase family protein n=1 Tax=unclassified Bradyrhizobium TaxID=2631580 RepID=UPI001FF9BE81|nr:MULTISPECIES: dienelactone hydrolase family protein [unclassified Bradyrhizobium]MCK1543479.1 dienelactone hydrolase family protein [Bradyrhizobium sp. 179]MCK1624625.1 dienelactone hydrolase family protein [Bradyrhizobium sp. 160]